jgi:putative ABC transport system substrate-binding protein
VEGQNLDIVYRYAEGHGERLPELAADLVRLKPDIILAAGNPAIQAVKQATSVIPIVMAIATSDPVATGLVASLARPGGNVTGVHLHTAELSAKRLQLLKEAVPRIARVALLWNPDISALDLRATQEAAQVMQVELDSVAVQGQADFEGALERVIGLQVDALILVPDPLLSARRAQLADMAIRHQLPAMDPQREFAVVGGLMAYGPNFFVMFGRVATYVDRILKGAKPADLPVEQPMTFDFVVNMKTARELGITFPNEIMLQVTEVIE